MRVECLAAKAKPTRTEKSSADIKIEMKSLIACMFNLKMKVKLKLSQPGRQGDWLGESRN